MCIGADNTSINRQVLLAWTMRWVKCTSLSPAYVCL